MVSIRITPYVRESERWVVAALPADALADGAGFGNDAELAEILHRYALQDSARFAVANVDHWEWHGDAATAVDAARALHARYPHMQFTVLVFPGVDGELERTMYLFREGHGVIACSRAYPGDEVVLPDGVDGAAVTAVVLTGTLGVVPGGRTVVPLRTMLLTVAAGETRWVDATVENPRPEFEVPFAVAVAAGH